MNKKILFYIAIMVVLLIVWHYRANIKDSIVHKVNDVRKASPYTDDRIEGDIKQAMDR